MSDFDFGVQKKELTPEEQKLCKEICYRWMREGSLIFKRLPNFMRMVGVIVIAYLIVKYLVISQAQTEVSAAGFWIWAVIVAGLFLYVLREALLLQRGNEIVLSQTEFMDNRHLLFFKSSFTVPWERLKATEESSSNADIIMNILALIFSPGSVLIVKDKESHKSRRYRSVTIRNYHHLRAAIIGRVGLTEKHESWHYE